MISNEAQRKPAALRFAVRDGIARLDPPEASAGRLSGLVAKLMAESEGVEFRSAERILDALERQGRTLAGYPRVRPADCDQFLGAIREVFDSYRRAFITADPRIVRRFEEMLDAFERTEVRAYPHELMRARTLHAEARLLLGDPGGARALVGPYADRIYKIEGDRDDILRILRLDCEAQAALGAVDNLGETALARARAAARLPPVEITCWAVWFIVELTVESFWSCADDGGVTPATAMAGVWAGVDRTGSDTTATK